MTPIKTFAGCFSGETLHANEAFVSPNAQRAERKRERARSTVGHVAQKEKRRKRINVDGVADLPEDELGDVFTG